MQVQNALTGKSSFLLYALFIFNVPDGWLQPEIAYVLGIKVIAENGNQKVRDIRFETK